MIFSSKARTLEKFSKKNLKFSSVPKIFFFSEENFAKNTDQILKKISEQFKNLVAVRSSCVSEDNSNNSMAGYFYSILNIDPNQPNKIKSEIINVINSYQSHKNKKNLVLIQQMVKNVAYSGVIMTCDKTSNSPYYIIDYTKGSDTTAVTAGSSSNNITFNYFSNSPVKVKNKLEKKNYQFYR